MYITPAIVAVAEQDFGRPAEMTAAFEITPAELAPIRRSAEKFRAHDVTMYIFATDDLGAGIPITHARLAVIAKHSYPPAAYRPPGGGVHPGESMEAGARRETIEETGLDVRITRYLVRARVRFTCGDDHADWVTHVFAARTCQNPAPEILSPVDTREIKEARWSSVAEVQGPIRRVLVETGRGLFAYRVALHDAVAAALETVSQLE